LIPKWAPGLEQRLGKFPKDQYFIPGALWFHAVSVGELNALLPLLKHFAGSSIVLSTGTAAAQNMAGSKLEQEIINNQIQLIYMPWDHPYIIEYVLERIKPSQLILMETEIWPGLINACHKRNIPVTLINARLSDSSYKLYKYCKFLLEDTFKAISFILAQSPADSRKFLDLGVEKSKVFMTGNIKFASLPLIAKNNAAQLCALLGYQESDCIIVAASTHPTEEAALIAIYQELKTDFNYLRLIIAPRHPERFTIVSDLINSAAHLNSVSYKDFKQVTTAGGSLPQIKSKDDILLIDTIGDLMQIFSIADIAFVGGTLVDKVGGHNVLEPAACALPVLIGPHYFKNTEIVTLMESAGALQIAETNLELKSLLQALIINPNKRVLMGSEGKHLVQEHRKILTDTVNKLKESFGWQLKK
jgi:3-deoxy-D-manno-octulosonic-acid transferase